MSAIGSFSSKISESVSLKNIMNYEQPCTAVEFYKTKKNKAHVYTVLCCRYSFGLTFDRLKLQYKLITVTYNIHLMK